jgi:hypothetical protein
MSLRRQSQTARFSWEKFIRLVDPLLSADQDATRPTMSPLRRPKPKEEPSALAAHAGIWAGCALKAHVT